MDPDRRRGLDAAVLLAALAVAWLTLTPAGGSGWEWDAPHRAALVRIHDGSESEPDGQR
jgi:hypothetical protein